MLAMRRSARIWVVAILVLLIYASAPANPGGAAANSAFGLSRTEALSGQDSGRAPALDPRTETQELSNLPASKYCPTDFEGEVVRLINLERTSRGLRELSIDVRLLEAAQLHSADMAAGDYFSHSSKDGRSFTDRINDAGYPWTSAGETIAAGYSTPTAVVQGWMNSSGHRAILLGSNYEHVGIGYAYGAGSTYGYYWTGDFGSSSDGGQAPAGCGTFSDVPEDHWAFDYIEALAAAGISEGFLDGTFRPANRVSRSEMAVFLERGMRSEAYLPPNADGDLFADVGATYWAAAWIEQLYADGITDGCTFDPLEYCPEANVDRAEMAVFLERAKHWPDEYEPPPATGNIFQDVSQSHWAAAWIEQLYADGITIGCSQDPPMYCPGDTVSRAEMAVFLVKVFNVPLP